MISLSFTPTSPLKKVSNIPLTLFLMITYAGKGVCHVVLCQNIGHLDNEIAKIMKKEQFYPLGVVFFLKAGGL